MRSISRQLLWPFSILVLAIQGCTSVSTNKALVLVSNTPLRSYVHSAVGANGRKGTRLFFPLLQIYDSHGRLIYVSHDANENAATLKDIPQNLSNLQAIPDTVPLQNVISEYPDFASKVQQIGATNLPTVLSVFLESCEACSVQENALETTQTRLNNRNVNLLVVKVARPD